MNKIQQPEALQLRHERLRSLVSSIRYSGTIRSFTWPLLPYGEVLYCIPTSILEVMKERQSPFRSGKEKPRLFSKEEMELESLFAQLCNQVNTIGIFANGPICFPLLQERFSPDISQHPLSTSTQINVHKMAVGILADFVPQELAYLGWLTSNPIYQRELKKLRRYWLTTKANPAYLAGRNHLKQLHDLPGQCRYSWQLHSEGCNAFLQFYRRWDLDRFASWDLPIQSSANLGGPSGISHLQEIDLNPCIQLSATRKLPSSVKVQTLLRQSKIDHLNEWQDILHLNRHVRFAEAFVIHFYQSIVLQKILGPRLKRRQTMLDDILAQAFKLSAPFDSMLGMKADTIKKIRQWYQHRLACC